MRFVRSHDSRNTQNPCHPFQNCQTSREKTLVAARDMGLSSASELKIKRLAKGIELNRTKETIRRGTTSRTRKYSL